MYARPWKPRPDARQSAMKAGLSRMAAHERDELGPKCPLVADPSLSVGRNAPPACRKPSMKRPIRLREKRAMKRSRFSNEQIAYALRQVGRGRLSRDG